MLSIYAIVGNSCFKVVELINQWKEQNGEAESGKDEGYFLDIDGVLMISIVEPECLPDARVR